MREKKVLLSSIGILLVVLVPLLFNMLSSGESLKFFSGIVVLGTISLLFIYIYKLSREYNDRVDKLSYSIKEVGNDVFDNLPIGIFTYDKTQLILWTNKYLKSLYVNDIVGSNVEEYFPGLLQAINNGDNYSIEINEDQYNFVINGESGIVYMFESTEYFDLQQTYNDERLCLGILTLDNYEEFISNLDAQTKTDVEYSVGQYIGQWCYLNQIYVRKFTSSKYIMVFNNRTLDIIKASKFILLDQVRAIGEEKNVPVTVSLGISSNENNVLLLGERAMEAIDLAQVRGGDQVVIKYKDLDTEFFGGRTDAVEKTARVRARIIAQSIEKLIQTSENIVIMGHVKPDQDSLGACIGIAKMAQGLGKEFYIHLDENELSKSMKKVMERLKDHEIYNYIKPENEILNAITKKTILFSVDNHKPSLVSSEKILEKCKSVIVIDHHRRGEEFIEDPILTYVEPYASSTCELITELIDYQKEDVKITPFESTVLLLGIIVDTKHFTYRTGGRTFDAAAWLKTKGADTIVVQELLKVDIETYFGISEIVKNTTIINDNITVSVASDDTYVSQVLLAQVADELLTIDEIAASFAIGKLKDERIAISARSLGDFNVQTIMEKLNGGGHLTNAATQMTDITIEEAYEKLIELINGRIEEREHSESNIA